MAGKLIVFEGIDSSGKATQQKLLIESLRNDGFDVEALDFPRYSEFFGSLVGRYLAGEFGEVKDLPVEFSSLLYSLDRYQIKMQIEKKLSQGKVLVANRYVFSNIAFQSAKFHVEKEKMDFWNWIECVESRMPKPSIVFFLDVSVGTAVSLMGGADRQKSYRKGKERDLHESDEAFLERVRHNYLLLSKKHNNWKIISCGSEGKMREKEDIAQEVFEKASKIIVK